MSSGIYNTAKARQEPLQQRLLSRVSSPRPNARGRQRIAGAISRRMGRAGMEAGEPPARVTDKNPLSDRTREQHAEH
jgi:hypothetical protein